LTSIFPEEIDTIEQVEKLIEKLSSHGSDFYEMAPTDPLVATLLLGQPSFDLSSFDSSTSPLSSDFLTYMPLEDSSLHFTHSMLLSH